MGCRNKFNTAQTESCIKQISLPDYVGLLTNGGGEGPKILTVNWKKQEQVWFHEVTVCLFIPNMMPQLCHQASLVLCVFGRCQRPMTHWIILHVKPDTHKYCFLSERLMFTLRIDGLWGKTRCHDINQSEGWILRVMTEASGNCRNTFKNFSTFNYLTWLLILELVQNCDKVW